jgi:hypothetical protein
LFFSKPIREKLINNLDGAKACWKQKSLSKRYHQSDISERGGTIFFWGLTETGHRIPLTLEYKHRVLFLLGISDNGKLFEVEFRVDHIVAALEASTLIPSLFTCFTILAFARGLHCIGGYYQAEYLPVIQNGIADALDVSVVHRKMAELISMIPTNTCLAGLQWLAIKRDDSSVIPLGPIELAGVGGISQTDLETITTLPIKDAYSLAFTEFLDQIVPSSNLPINWLRNLSIENGRNSGILTYDRNKELAI